MGKSFAPPGDEPPHPMFLPKPILKDKYKNTISENLITALKSKIGTDYEIGF